MGLLENYKYLNVNEAIANSLSVRRRRGYVFTADGEVCLVQALDERQVHIIVQR